jgi:hypothetical protein
MMYNDLPAEITAWRAVWGRLGLGPQINGHPLIVYQAAQLLLGRAENRAAELAFREVVARVPDHLPSLRWLAVLLHSRGLTEEADQFRRRCEELESAAETEPPPAAQPGPDEPLP